MNCARRRVVDFAQVINEHKFALGITIFHFSLYKFLEQQNQDLILLWWGVGGVCLRVCCSFYYLPTPNPFRQKRLCDTIVMQPQQTQLNL